MENTSARLKRIMKERNLRQVDIIRLAEPYCKEYNLKLTKSDMSQFVSGKVEPGQWKLTILGKALNVSEVWLMGYDVPMERNDTAERDKLSDDNLKAYGLMPIKDMHAKRVPLIGSVAAGEPIVADETWDVYVDAPAKADYALRIEGDSMEPTYLTGDVVYICCQDDVDDGTVAVVLIDDCAAIKHVYHMPQGLQLVSNNPKYPPKTVTYGEYDVIRILGIVVGYTRMYK